MSSYKQVIDWLNEVHPFMVTPLMNLGSPIFNTNIKTAQVEKREDNDFQLVINPEFMSNHSVAECAGVLMHELYHIIFNHLSEFDKFENNQARIIAQECIVNDSVLEEGMELPDIGLHYGMDWVQYNASFLPTKVVYDDLMKNPDQLPEEPETICVDITHGNGDPMQNRELFDAIFNGADIDEASQSMKSILQDAAQKAGSGFSFKTVTKTGKKISLKWTELINQIHPNTFTDGGKSRSSSTWARPRRKLAGTPSRAFLPDKSSKDEFGFGGNRKPKIILALDTSGSVPLEMVDELIDLANSIPGRKVDVQCCTFSTYYVPLDHKKDDQDIAQGGTDFEAIVEFIKTVPSSDKTSVIVITDGYASFGYYGRESGVPKNLNSHWHWLVFNGDGIQDSRVTKNIYKYKDYVG